MTVRCFAQLAMKSGRRMFQNEKKRKSWVCIDPDCAQFRREVPKKGEKVFELAQVNQYDYNLFRVAHGFIYLNEVDGLR